MNISVQSIKLWKWCMSLAKRCTNMEDLKAIHAVFTTHGLHRNNYAISKLIAFCALSDAGSLSYASLLFTNVVNPNSFMYNTLIRAYSRSSRPHIALHYFNLLLNNQTLRPDQHTFPFVLIACANLNSSSVIEGKKIHCWLIKNGLALSNGHVRTALVRFYAECKALHDARNVFDEIPNRDAIQYNVLMNGYMQHGFFPEALTVFRNMLISRIEPDEFCITTALTACAHLGALEQGKWIHEYVRKRKGLVSDMFVGTALVDMYVKCGSIEMGAKVFETMPKRNAFSWAAIVGGFAAHGYAREAICCLERIQVEDKLKPDGVVLLGALAACTHAGLQKEGQFLLENMENKYGVVPKHEHYSCMVDLLCKAGQLDEAMDFISKMPMKPLASVWGALLSGCRAHNKVEIAERAVKELLMVENENEEEEEEGAYVQLANIYLAVGKRDEASRVRRRIGDRGLKKSPGCSAVEVDGELHEFVAGDVSHVNRVEISAMLVLMSLNDDDET